MQALAEAIESIYRDLIGADYPREAPITLPDLPDVLNNKALSFLELGMPEEAEEIWKESLELDAHHLESTYNLGLHEWRTGKIVDQNLVQRMAEARTSHDRSWRGA